MAYPKVSIIVPNYNHARYLVPRLESILGQTYQDFELILLDDCSSDDSRAILRKYSSHARVAYVEINERNTGVACGQWNKGVRVARGEYVWIAESDDTADTGFLDVLVPLLDKNPTVAIAYCQSTIINDEGEPIGSFLDWTSDLHERRWRADFVNSGPDEVCKFLIAKNTVPNVSAALIRRSAYLESGMAPEHMKMAGDWYFYLTLLRHWDIAFVAQPLNCNRVHPNTSRVHDTKSKVFTRCIEGYLVARLGFRTFQIEPRLRHRVTYSIMQRWLDRVSISDMGTTKFWYLVTLACTVDRRCWFRVPFRIFQRVRLLMRTRFRSCT